MKNPICISTGLVYRLTNNRNEMIKMIKEFYPDGVELSFAYPQYLFDFKMSKENLEYLRSLKYNSIHAPWKEVVYGDNELCHKVLSAIEKLYKQINAYNVVVHLKSEADVNIFNDYDFNISTENGDWKADGLPNTIDGVEMMLNRSDKLKFVFDFAHAITVSLDDTPRYIEKFKDRIHKSIWHI